MCSSPAVEGRRIPNEQSLQRLPWEAAQQGATAATRKPPGYNLWYRSGGGRGCFNAGGQRFLVQLSAQPLGGGERSSVTKAYQDRQREMVSRLRIDAGDRIETSTVPIRSNHRSGSGLCLTAVAFVPPRLSREIAEQITRPLAEVAPGHYYLPPASFHITVKNVRTVHDPPLFSDRDVELACEVFSEVVPRHRQILISLEEVVSFSTSISLVGYTAEGLGALVRELDARLTRAGVPDNKQYASRDIFFANVTLARFVHAPEPELLAHISKASQVFRRTLLLETIYLVTCDAVCHPSSRKVHGSYQLQPGSTAP